MEMLTELKNARDQKNAFDGFINKPDTAKERISEPEYGSAGNTPTEMQGGQNN